MYAYYCILCFTHRFQLWLSMCVDTIHVSMSPGRFRSFSVDSVDSLPNGSTNMSPLNQPSLNWFQTPQPRHTTTAIFVSHPRGLLLGNSPLRGPSSGGTYASPVFRRTTRKHQPFSLEHQRSYLGIPDIVDHIGRFKKCLALNRHLILRQKLPLARKGSWYCWQSRNSFTSEKALCWILLDWVVVGRKAWCDLHVTWTVLFLDFLIRLLIRCRPRNTGHFSRDSQGLKQTQYTYWRLDGESEIKLSGISNSVPAEWQHPLWDLAWGSESTKQNEASEEPNHAIYSNRGVFILSASPHHASYALPAILKSWTRLSFMMASCLQMLKGKHQLIIHKNQR